MVLKYLSILEEYEHPAKQMCHLHKHPVRYIHGQGNRALGTRCNSHKYFLNPSRYLDAFEMLAEDLTAAL